MLKIDIELNMFFALNFSEENGFEYVSVHVRDIGHLFCVASDILKECKENLFLFLFVDGTLIDKNAYRKTLEPGTELFVCRSNQKEKLLIYFDVKRFCFT